MTKREKRLLIIGMIVIIFAFSLKYLLLPGINRIYTLNRQLRESKFELEKTRLQLLSIPKYSSKLKKLIGEKSSLEGFFYQGKPAAVRLQILEYLDSQVKKIGLNIENKEFNIEQNSRQEEIVKLSYSLQLSGSYQQFLSFLTKISRSQKYYTVSQLDMKINSDKSSLLAYIVIDTYCIKGGGQSEENKI